MQDRHIPRSPWEDDTTPSRLEELTSNSRLAQREQYAVGWRRNLLIAALVVVFAAVIALLAAR